MLRSDSLSSLQENVMTLSVPATNGRYTYTHTVPQSDNIDFCWCIAAQRRKNFRDSFSTAPP